MQISQEFYYTSKYFHYCGEEHGLATVLLVSASSNYSIVGMELGAVPEVVIVVVGYGR